METVYSTIGFVAFWGLIVAFIARFLAPFLLLLFYEFCITVGDVIGLLCEKIAFKMLGNSDNFKNKKRLKKIKWLFNKIQYCKLNCCNSDICGMSANDGSCKDKYLNSIMEFVMETYDLSKQDLNYTVIVFANYKKINEIIQKYKLSKVKLISRKNV